MVRPGALRDLPARTRAALQLAAAVSRQIRRGPVNEECAAAFRATSFGHRLHEGRAMIAIGTHAVGMTPRRCWSRRVARPLDDRPPVGADADEFQVLTEHGHRLVVDVEDDLAVRLPDHAIPCASPQPKLEIGVQARPRQLRHYVISVQAWYGGR